jgi:hypothetical protein
VATDLVAAVGMMRDEEDVARHVVEHLADEGVDLIIVADNLSKDGTRDALEDARRDGVPVTVVDDPEVGYHQADKMTALAAQAAGQGADWIVPFDADELWYVRGTRLAAELRNLPRTFRVARATMFNHFCTALDEDDPNPFRAMVYRKRELNPMGKVAYRWHADARLEQGSHSVSFPHEMSAFEATSFPLEIRHFPYRSARHMVRKARNGAEAYAATDLPQHVGAHWRQYGALIERFGPEALENVFREHFWFLSPTDNGMVLDPAPFKRFTT